MCFRRCSPFCVSLVSHRSPAMATGGGESSTAAQFAELLSAIKRVEANVDEKLSQMRRKLREEHESADDRIAKKLRLEK